MVDYSNHSRKSGREPLVEVGTPIPRSPTKKGAIQGDVGRWLLCAEGERHLKPGAERRGGNLGSRRRGSGCVAGLPQLPAPV